MPDDNNNLDDDFLAELQDGTTPDDANPFTTEGSEAASADPFSSLESDAATSPAEPSPFDLPVPPAESATPAVAQEPEAKGKKGKKEKKAKAAKKEKKAKEPKTPKAPKATKAKKPKRPRAGSPAPVIFLLVVMLLALVVANAYAFLTYGAGCATYLIALDVLGVLALAIPCLLLVHLRARPISLFDFFVALAAIFSIASAILLVSEQARDYGSSSKVSAVPSIAASETLDA